MWDIVLPIYGAQVRHSAFVSGSWVAQGRVLSGILKNFQVLSKQKVFSHTPGLSIEVQFLEKQTVKTMWDVVLPIYGAVGMGRMWKSF